MISVRQIKSQGSNSMIALARNIESLLYRATTANYPDYWEEDIVSLTLIKGLAGIFGAGTVQVPGNTIRTGLKAYLMRGDQSIRLADLGLLVSIRYHDGQTIEGIAALRTAAKDRDKNTFSSLKKDQMKKMNSAFPHSQVLLYDYDHITGMAFPASAEAVLGSYPLSWNDWVPYTHGAVISTALTSRLGLKSTGLYKTSLPLAYQLCFRYLYGLDMDYLPLHTDIARGLKPDRGAFKHLICLSVSHGSSDLPDIPGVSADIYSPLE
jgi:hypothetical protein